MKILILGNGAREHALLWKLSKSPLVDTVFVSPGNGGTFKHSVNAGSGFSSILKWCEENSIDLLIPGSETPIAAGIYDFFASNKAKTEVFAPDMKAAKLESSKIFAKKFAKTHGVLTPKFWTSENNDQEVIKKIDELNGTCVIKYDGLAGGKGSFVCSSREEALDSYKKIKAKFGSEAKILIEEKLSGKEVSIIGITDGNSIKLFAPSCDHKPLYENDTGPNTGGMGAFSPVPFVDEKMLDKIVEKVVSPTIRGIREEGFNYTGFLYFGLMIANDEPYLLEYNVRLGDPEASVILPILKNDLTELVLLALSKKLDMAEVEFNERFFVTVVLASRGYPEKYETGYKITGLDKLKKDTLVFHAGTKIDDGELVTSGGRVLDVVCYGNSIDEGVKKVYEECEKIHFEGVYYRKDIGISRLK